ncbi:MAG TPA: CUAEP/CCAEP-tail radical SAM protein [Chloroflexota bacterium]|nr:CUAEP/CCAEP-tail radical SAM protein [Chloroflexota bacterium]
MNVLLLSTYELGHQPLAVARPAAHLLAAGHRVRCQDLAVERLDEARVREATLIGISVPMHTATRLGVRLAERVRALNPDAHVCFYGLYAALHADVLLGPLADSVVGGEFEAPLVALAAGLDAAGRAPRAALRDAAPPEGVLTARGGRVYLGRQAFLVPRRDLLPPLGRYARLQMASGQKLVGYVEASRGCAHQCRHCPITPVYGGRLRIVPADVVLADVRQLVARGAEHITFGDPDFFNGVRHSLCIVEALHAEFPALTFDATIKVEHLLEHRAYLPALRAAGCLFVVSAVEAVQDDVLMHFRKGHTAADVEVALGLAAAAGIPLRPTFVPFTPWTSLADYLDLLDFVARHGLVRHVDPVQFAIRLLVPRGSALVGTPAMTPHLGPFDAATFSYRWTHPDPRMDALQVAVAALVEEAARAGEDAAATFARIHALARAAAGRPPAASPPPERAPAMAVPRLTEPWFC